MKFAKPMSKRKTAMLNKATELAKLSTCKQRHGAIITRGGNTIAVGINYNVNDPKLLGDELAATHAAVHAEVAALNACKKTELSGAIIYVARVLKNDNPAMSKPCSRCQEALKARGIKTVYYTIDSQMDL